MQSFTDLFKGLCLCLNESEQEQSIDSESDSTSSSLKKTETFSIVTKETTIEPALNLLLLIENQVTNNRETFYWNDLIF